MWKGENAGYQHFLLFPQFSKALCFRVIKSQDCVVKGWTAFHLQGQLWEMEKCWWPAIPPIQDLFSTLSSTYFCIFVSSTLHHTIPTFNNSKTVSFRKHWGKKRKCWWPAFSHFPKLFSIIPKPSFNFSFIFILSSTNAFILDKSIILSIGKVKFIVCKCFQFRPV